MIVTDLDFNRIPINPTETDAPLIIDLDRVLSRSNTLEHFKPVTRRHTKIRQTIGSIQCHQLPPRTLDYIGRKTGNVRRSKIRSVSLSLKSFIMISSQLTE